jgi:hypothetical protein
MFHFARIPAILAAVVLGSTLVLPVTHGSAPQATHAAGAATVAAPLQGFWITPAPDSAAITPVIVSAQLVASGAPDGPLEVKYTVQAFRNGRNLGQQTVIRSFGTSTVSVILSPPCALGRPICLVRTTTRMTLTRSGPNLRLEAIVHTVGIVGFPAPDISYSETLTRATL